ncbi:hypothetical protein Fmac_014133 [Flemingia macrophylla]|uniref:LisH domain-containing protein n=1 Tax=Flemingia macrophylla TaxID=520843 RepID=A0ABD1MAX9_9FABA
MTFLSNEKLLEKSVLKRTFEHKNSPLEFERYLYDYLVKRNMQHTAEVFKNETGLQLDHDASSSDAMDVPEGFLLEWWSHNCEFEFFRERVQTNVGYSAPSNCGPIQVNGELPLPFLPSSHQEPCVELPQLCFPSTYQKISGEFPQLLLPSSHQEELPTHTVGTVDVAKPNGPEAEAFVRNNSKAKYPALSEEADPVIENLLNSFWLFEQEMPTLFDKSTGGELSKNMENLLPREEGSTAMNEFAGSPVPKDDDNKSETSDCSSLLRIITTDADASKEAFIRTWTLRPQQLAFVVWFFRDSYQWAFDSFIMSLNCK